MEGDATNRGFLMNQLEGTRATDRFARAMQLFGAGSGNADAVQRRGLATLGAGGGGLSAQDAQILAMIQTQIGAGQARSGANAQAGQMMNNYNMGQQGMWASMINSATEAAGNAAGSFFG
jgi:hypothetical protein